MNNAKSFSISFVGIDGTGKTTQAKKLQQTLRTQGINARYVHLFSVGSTMPSKLFANSIAETWLTRLDILSKTKAGAMAELTIKLLLVIFQSWITVSTDKLRNKVIIYDRYFYDKIIATLSSCGKILNTNFKKALIITAKIIPKPDVTIIFRMKPETTIRRKNEHSLNDAKEICALYDELARILSVKAINSELDINEVKRKVQRLCAQSLL